MLEGGPFNWVTHVTSDTNGTYVRIRCLSHLFILSVYISLRMVFLYCPFRMFPSFGNMFLLTSEHGYVRKGQESLPIVNL